MADSEMKSNEPQGLEESKHAYDYDMFVIGGGSGGLACAKAAQEAGAKVAVADFVKPSPQGITWKVGGTWVNVGWIPKKLMHYSATLGEAHIDRMGSGWEQEKPKHDWEKMILNVNNHIRGINFGYKSDMRKRGIKFYEKFASFVDPHTVQLLDKKGKTELVTANHFVIATGGRPLYPDIPGAKEYGITSDDIFWLKKSPGKTLVVGASYVALEWAGFLHSFGNDVSVCVRSIFLRGFDQDMANKVAKDMEEHVGINFIRNTTPTKVEKDEETGKLTWYLTSGEEETSIEVDTVLFAIGRYAVTRDLNLENAGLKVEPNGKFITDEFQRTNVDNIYAIGDVLHGKLELTPTAIQAGRLLAKRLYSGGTAIMDFYDVPTTIFTPLEYGWVGYSEEDAKEKYGDAIKVFHTYFKPLEWNYAKSVYKYRNWYVKVIINTDENDRVIGYHVLAPNAGEVTQGVGIAIKIGLTKSQLDNCVGIHPTVAEEVTDLKTDKAINPDPVKTDCWS